MKTPPVNIVVMAQAPVPGQVQTRLQEIYSPQQAASIHRAMLETVLRRFQVVGEAAFHPRFVLALDDPTALRGLDVPDPWTVTDQGQGDQGQRMAHVWQHLQGAVVFFSIHSPDLPQTILRKIVPLMQQTHAVIGPTGQGGYWTLASKTCQPRLLEGIDWGTDGVYHQTIAAAKASGVRLFTLPKWFDVDNPHDLEQLRRRLRTCREPQLQRLAQRLDLACEDQAI